MAKRRTAEQIAQALEAKVRAERARLQLAQLKRVRGAIRDQQVALSTYRAATRDRTTRDWRAKLTSGDSAILPDLLTIDARARGATRDDCHASSVKRAFTRNVVGRGITAAATATLPNGKLATLFNLQADALFHDWSRSKQCDIERRRPFWRIQRWAIGEMVETGEAFVIRSIVRDELTGRRRLVLQLVEAEQLDRYKLQHAEGSVVNEVRSGVEIDEHGAPVAYWFYRRHPHDVQGMSRPAPIMLESERVPAWRVCHLYDPERVRQTRGVSRLAPALERLRNLDTYDYAQIIAAKAQASIGVLITTDPVNGERLGMAQPAGEDGPDRQDADGNDELAFQPFMVARLQPGEKVEPFTPTRPGGEYDPFTVRQLRSIAAGCGISYEQVARDFTGGTYSSQRQAMMEDRREFEPLQQILIDDLCQPVWADFIELAVLNGDLIAPDFHRRPTAWTYAEWRGQGWPWIDPAKEAEASEKQLALNLTTRRQLLLDRGEDWREIDRQRAEELRSERTLAAIHQASPQAPSQPIPTEQDKDIVDAEAQPLQPEPAAAGVSP